MSASGDLCFESARSLAARMRARDVSAREVMEAHLRQIARCNPTLNAIVALQSEEACLALADEADARLARGEAVGPLHGLPWAFKDLEPAVGFPCTKGSPLLATWMPEEDSVVVERIRRAGALAIGKTNVPEFGMGSHTFNSVYGTTRNPYDPKRSAGGSSGGAGAAVAAGLLPMADGSDYGGSLRNPGNFDNVVGFRPSVGLVPNAPSPLPFHGFLVKGPLARSVGDAAFLLGVMAGADARDPACFPSDPHAFAGPLERDFAGVRVAWCPDLGGLPLDPRVRKVVEAQRARFEALGCVVEEACPDLEEADLVFATLRAFYAAAQLGALLPGARDAIKPEALEEAERGLRLTRDEIAGAQLAQGRVLERMRAFEQRFAFFVCAVNQVPPFEAELRWPAEIDGVRMTNYLDWMKSACRVTTTFRPAISVPAGFTPEGLPVGVQIVGSFRDDLGVLALAHAFEEASGAGRVRPALAAA